MKYILSLVLIVFEVGAMSPTSEKKVFFIVGPAGSGKTTIADLVKNKHRSLIDHYSVGNLLREEAKIDTKRGRMIKDMLAQAIIMPIEIGMDVVSRAIKESSKTIILLDGFPPTLEYAIAFENLTKQNCSVKLVGAIEVFVEEEVAAERVLNRNRTDDDRSVFEKRYKRYMQNSIMLNEWYKKNCTFDSIDGSQTLEDSSRSIEARILSDI